VVVAAVYELADEEARIDTASLQTFIRPLKQIVQQHAWLWAVVKDKSTEKSYYAAVSSLDLAHHVVLTDREVNDTDGVAALIRSSLDEPLPDGLPPWRVTVARLPPIPASDSTPQKTRCLIAFAFSHVLGDGMTGLAFHHSFLEAWQSSLLPSTDGVPETSTRVTCTATQSLPEPFDTPARLPISWGFLLGPLIAALLPKPIAHFFGLRAHANTIDAGTWTGTKIFQRAGSPRKGASAVAGEGRGPVGEHTKLRILEIDATVLQGVLCACRAHDAKLTALLQQLIVRALSSCSWLREGAEAPANFASQSAVNMRRSVHHPALQWGLYATAYYELHPRVAAAHPTGSSTLPDAAWEAAAATTRRLADQATRLTDQPMALLRYAPSVRGWVAGHLGQRRDGSFDVSNLGVFDGRGAEEKEATGRISKTVFAQPANVMSSPLTFNVITAHRGSLVCAVTWQEGALGVGVEREEELVDGICESLEADFKGIAAQGA